MKKQIIYMNSRFVSSTRIENNKFRFSNWGLKDIGGIGLMT